MCAQYVEKRQKAETARGAGGCSRVRVACRPWRRVFGAELGKTNVGTLRALDHILFVHDSLHDPHDPPPVLPAMDADLIKLVNKLQDTFANLGAPPSLPFPTRQFTCLSRRRTGHAPARCGAFPDSL